MGWGVSTHTSWHKQFQIGLNTSECTIYRLFSFFSAVPNRFTSRHNACFRDIFFLLTFQIDSTIVRRQNTPFTVLVFKLFSAVPNRFKYRHNACSRDIVFFFFCSSKSFQIPSECMLKRHWFHVFSAVQNRFKFNTARMHALDTLFSCFLCSFKSFQIPPGWII